MPLLIGSSTRPLHWRSCTFHLGHLGRLKHSCHLLDPCLMPEIPQCYRSVLKALAKQGSSVSLNNLKVVQNCKDVLRHKYISCIQGHSNNRDQHGIEDGPLPGLQHVERGDQQVLVVEPGHVLPGPAQRAPFPGLTRHLHPPLCAIYSDLLLVPVPESGDVMIVEAQHTA